MTIKERLVAALMDDGHSFVPACEAASELIRDLKNRPPGRYRIGAGKVSLTIDVANPGSR